MVGIVDLYPVCDSVFVGFIVLFLVFFVLYSTISILVYHFSLLLKRTVKQNIIMCHTIKSHNHTHQAIKAVN